MVTSFIFPFTSNPVSGGRLLCNVCCPRCLLHERLGASVNGLLVPRALTKQRPKRSPCPPVPVLPSRSVSLWFPARSRFFHAATTTASHPAPPMLKFYWIEESGSGETCPRISFTVREATQGIKTSGGKKLASQCPYKRMADRQMDSYTEMHYPPTHIFYTLCTIIVPGLQRLNRKKDKLVDSVPIL